MKTKIVRFGIVVGVLVAVSVLPASTEMLDENRSEGYLFGIIGNGNWAKFGACNYEEGFVRRYFDSLYVNVGVGLEGGLVSRIWNPMTKVYAETVRIWFGPLAPKQVSLDIFRYNWNPERQYFSGQMPEGLTIDMTLYSPFGWSQTLDPVNGVRGMILPTFPSTWDTGYSIVTNIDATRFVANLAADVPEPGGQAVLVSGLIGAMGMCLRRRRHAR